MPVDEQNEPLAALMALLASTSSITSALAAPGAVYLGIAPDGGPGPVLVVRDLGRNAGPTDWEAWLDQEWLLDVAVRGGSAAEQNVLCEAIDEALHGAWLARSLDTSSYRIKMLRRVGAWRRLERPERLDQESGAIVVVRSSDWEFRAARVQS